VSTDRHRPDVLEQGVLRLGHLAVELDTDQCAGLLRDMATVDRGGLTVTSHD
jgi:hypothetical protein